MNACSIIAIAVQQKRKWLVLAFVGLLFFPLEAAAYIDPGAGSLILQGIVGALATLAAVVATSWGRIRGLLARYAKFDRREER